MSKYVIKFVRFQASAIVEYDDAGYLIQVQLEPGSFQETHIKSFFLKTPWKEIHLDMWRNTENVTVDQFLGDISFDAFYNAYAHKVSKRSRAEAIWKQLPDPEKVKAIAFISHYNNFLIQSPGINKLYPETYLTQQRWNN